MLHRNLTDSQLREWYKFYELEPWGSEMEWLRSSIIAAAVTNTIPRKSGAKAVTPADYMPAFGPIAAPGKPNTKALRADLFGMFEGHPKQADKE